MGCRTVAAVRHGKVDGGAVCIDLYRLIRDPSLISVRQTGLEGNDHGHSLRTGIAVTDAILDIFEVKLALFDIGQKRDTLRATKDSLREIARYVDVIQGAVNQTADPRDADLPGVHSRDSVAESQLL